MPPISGYELSFIEVWLYTMRRDESLKIKLNDRFA